MRFRTRFIAGIQALFRTQCITPSSRPLSRAILVDDPAELDLASAGLEELLSWAVVATGDKAAGSDVVRSMAMRANAKVVEVEGSHVIMISQPDAVTGLILEAARAVSEDAPAGAQP